MASTLLNYPPYEAPPSDVVAALAGDRDAFGRLYQLHHPAVFRYILFRTGRRVLAQDLAHDTFTKALASLDRFTWRGTDIGAWFVTIARNIVYDYFKSSRYKSELLAGDAGPLAAMMQPADVQVDDTADTYADAWRDMVIRRFMSQLNVDHRECLKLRFLDGLSVAETAARMGKNEGAIKALQYRATGALRRLMQEAGNPLGSPLS